MSNYTAKYVGEGGKMADTLKELDGFIWNNSLENHYREIERKDVRSWICESNEDTIEALKDVFQEIEFTPICDT